MSAGGWIFSILATLIFLALIVALVYWLLSATTSGGVPRGDTRESPKEILDRRLANGELSVEQYRQLCDTLNAPGGASAQMPPPAPQSPARTAGASG